MKRNTHNTIQLTNRGKNLIALAVSLVIVAVLSFAILQLMAEKADNDNRRNNQNAVTYMEDQAMQVWHAEYGTYTPELQIEAK